MSRPELSEVLAEVNLLRAERGMEPLSEMPKQDPTVGSGELACCCPMTLAMECAYTLPGISKSLPAVAIYAGRDEREVFLPPVCDAFIRAFDNAAYPELMA